jgi:uncharacterized DUF497 family protein
MFDVDISFEWDDAKAEANWLKHRVTFDFAMEIFGDEQVVILGTSRERDGEDREKAVGFVDGKLYTAVFHRRGRVIRIISARRANAPEERAYGNR